MVILIDFWAMYFLHKQNRKKPRLLWWFSPMFVQIRGNRNKIVFFGSFQGQNRVFWSFWGQNRVFGSNPWFWIFWVADFLGWDFLDCDFLGCDFLGCDFLGFWFSVVGILLLGFSACRTGFCTKRCVSLIDFVWARLQIFGRDRVFWVSAVGIFGCRCWCFLGWDCCWDFCHVSAEYDFCLLRYKLK